MPFGSGPTNRQHRRQEDRRIGESRSLVDLVGWHRHRGIVTGISTTGAHHGHGRRTHTHNRSGGSGGSLTAREESVEGTNGELTEGNLIAGVSRTYSSPDISALSVDEILIMAEEGLLRFDDDDVVNDDSDGNDNVTEDNADRANASQFNIDGNNYGQHAGRTASIESSHGGGNGTDGIGHRVTGSLSSVSLPGGSPERQLSRSDASGSRRRRSSLDNIAAVATSSASTVEAGLAAPVAAAAAAAAVAVAPGAEEAPRIPNGSFAPTTPVAHQQLTGSTSSQVVSDGAPSTHRRQRYRTKSKLGIRHGLRRTGRLFRGKRRRLSPGTGDDDDGVDDEVDVEDDGRCSGMGGDGISPLNGDGRMRSGRRFSQTSPPASMRTVGSARRVGFLTPSCITSVDDDMMEPEWDETTTIVRGVESTLRYVLIVLGAFMLGASKPELASVVSKAAELGCAAWVTCAVILVLTAFRGGGREPGGGSEYVPEEDDAIRTVSASPIAPVYQHVEARAVPTEETPLLNNSYDPGQDLRRRSVEVAEELSRIAPTTVKMPHPELEDVHFVNCVTNERIIPNSGPVVLDNDLFHGKLLMMVRTSDADEPSPSVQGAFSAKQQSVSDYFRTKQRRFEFQFQLKLKKVPEGPLFLSCEVDEPIKMGMVQRAFIGACLNFVKKMNKGFHCSLTGQDGVSQEDMKAGRYEKTHIAFTVDASMDALVATEPGSPLPTLGEPIREDPNSLRYRKKGGLVDWNTDVVYSMALYSSYVDFSQWKCLNFPGIKPFSMTSVGGSQPVNLMLYILKNNAPDEESKYHYECDKEMVTHLEISHAANMSVGPHDRKCTTGETLPARPRLLDTRAVSAESAVQGDSFLDDAEDVDEEGNVAGVDGDDAEEDAATLEEVELAEGMYLRSGDPIILREAVSGPADDTKQGIYVANGGGFAIVQSQQAMIIIEKAKSDKCTASSHSQIIKSGDIVSVKLIVRRDAGKEQVQETKYLSIHRGWWLKWVTNLPKHNGSFKIQAHDIAGALDTVSLYSGLQMNYIQLGQSFSLHHKRWSRFQVGVSLDSSVKFGGRMLGLHKKSSSSVAAADDVDEVEGMDEQPQNPFGNPDAFVSKGGKKQWMRPVRFRADAFDAMEENHVTSTAAKGTSEDGPSKPTSTLQSYSFRLDAPAWIEMTHRTRRQRQRAYVVRVCKKAAGSSDVHSQYSLRLKTGKDLASVLQLGLKQRGDNSVLLAAEDIGAERETTPPARRPMHARDEECVLGDAPLIEAPATVSRRRSYDTNATNDAKSTKRLSLTNFRDSEPALPIDAIPPSPASFHFENDCADEPSPAGHKRASSLDALSDLEYESLQVVPAHEADSDSEGVDEDEDEMMESDEEDFDYVDDMGLAPLNTKRRKKKWIKSSAARKSAVKVAKSVKTGTAMTGKQVYRQGRKVGKGTVYASKAAGRAITSVPTPATLHMPPRREPRKRANLRRGTVKDHHIAINKAVNRRSLKRSSSLNHGEATKIHAGRLCAPDQSCRTVSRVLEEISVIADRTKDADMMHLVETQAETSSDLETWFLRGDAVELGIVPAKNTDVILAESVVARCLWESHWREEWCALYKSRIEFYAPFSKKPTQVLPLDDVQSVRSLTPSDRLHPLPGVSLLVVETAWRCTYLAFADDACRNAFSERIKAALFHSLGEGRIQDDVYQAHLWQGFSAQSLVASGRGKWAPISSSSKRKQRIILNGRRMGFDVDSFDAGSSATATATDEGVEVRGTIENEERFVEGLLMKACSFSVESLEKNPKDFVDFLDATCRLRSLSLADLDLASKQTYCLVLNIYHCLLQHALLLSIGGPPDKKTVGHFKRCSCYEIGGDVFSLAELECCIIRGRMSAPVNARSPYVDAPKSSAGYRFYALRTVDPRINFVLNQGDTSSLPTVPVLNPEVMEEQLNAATSAFLSRQVTVDVSKRVILVPKICDVYRKDFGEGDPYDCVSFCLQYLDEATQEKIIELFTDETNAPSIRYRSSSDHFQSNLQLML